MFIIIVMTPNDPIIVHTVETVFISSMMSYYAG